MEENGWFRLGANQKNQSKAYRYSQPKSIFQKPEPEPAKAPPPLQAEAGSIGLGIQPAASVVATEVMISPPCTAHVKPASGTAVHEAMADFTHSKPRERVVHAKGFGAFGYFQNYHSMRAYTMLPFLQEEGKQTPVLTRFSLAIGNRGTPDSSRNLRGFSTKFYTDCGIFDLLCNHIPVFIVRDPARFTEAIRAFSPSPSSNLSDPKRFWDFVATAPEATHFLTWLYSDVGTVKSLRHISASSVNTYVWRNADDVCRYVRYHWVPLAGESYIDREESAWLAGENPDVAGQDLYTAIENDNPSEFELQVQLMSPEDITFLSYNPLDPTKIWDEASYPPAPVGRLVLNRNPEDYEDQIEKAAFSPANLLEGAEFSDDRLLQARATVYWDAQRYRLGAGFRSLAVNKQKGWTPDCIINPCFCGLETGSVENPQQVDNFSQAGERYQSLCEEEKERLIENLSLELALVSKETRLTVLNYFHQASDDFGRRLEEQLLSTGSNQCGS